MNSNIKSVEKVATSSGPSLLINNRYQMYSDGCIYDTEKAEDIPQYIFNVRRTLLEKHHEWFQPRYSMKFLKLWQKELQEGSLEDYDRGLIFDLKDTVWDLSEVRQHLIDNKITENEEEIVFRSFRKHLI